jgi:hypothetical protein
VARNRPRQRYFRSNDSRFRRGRCPARAAGRDRESAQRATHEHGTGRSPRHRAAVSKAGHGFVPISFDRHVDLQMQSNPSTERGEFTGRLRQAVDARKAGVRSLHLGDRIREVGAACFTRIAGAWPDSDYEIDEAGPTGKRRLQSM